MYFFKFNPFLCVTVMWMVPFGDMLNCLAFSFFLAELIGILEEKF